MNRTLPSIVLIILFIPLSGLVQRLPSAEAARENSIRLSSPAAAAGAGDLDLTFAGFGSGGIVVTSGEALWYEQNNGMALQPDGKIVVVGISEYTPHDPVVLRYLPNGILDSTFGGDGTVVIYTDYDTDGRGVAVQADGKIVVVGRDMINSGQFMLARLTPNGEMDASFGNDGLVYTDFQGGRDDYASAVLLQPDGKIVACGKAHEGGDDEFAVARYNSDGSLDLTFNNDGKVGIGFGDDENCYDIALQSDGKLVLVGRSYDMWAADSDFAVARLKPDGTLDDSFDFDGKLTTAFGSDWDWAYAVAIQPDGRILAAGDNLEEILVARYLPDGSLDNTFDGDGKLSLNSGNSAHGMRIQPDGKILLLGYRFASGFDSEIAVHRLNNDGTLDVAFDGDGMRFINLTTGADEGQALALLADGRMIAYGESDGDHVLVRLWPDGSLAGGGIQVLGFEDPFFGVNSQEGAYDLALQPDGKAVLAGYVEDAAGIDRNFALARFHPDGLLDTSFGAHGRVSFGFGLKETAHAVVIQPDGKIVVAGTSDEGGSNPNFMIARFHPDGSPDGDFGFLGFNLVDFVGDADNGNALALTPDGKIVVAGLAVNGVNTVFALARFNDNGVLDTTFDTDGKLTFLITSGATHKASAVIVQPDLKIIVAGYAIINTNADFALVRFNPDGSLDGSFGVNGSVVTDIAGDSDAIYRLVRQSDGSLVAAGMARVAGDRDFSLARYTSGGVLDTTFGTGGKVIVNLGGTDNGNGLDVRGDGRIIMAGCTDNRFALAQFLPDGTLDPLFGANGEVISNFVGDDECASAARFIGPNRVLAAGNQYVDGNRNLALARFETTVDLGDATNPVYMPIVLR